jgi:type I restriction enzyme, S subunit
MVIKAQDTKLKPGYKQTELGIIPEDWEVLPITKVTNEIFLGLTSKVDYVSNGGIPLVRATDIASGRLSFNNTKNISTRQHKTLTKYHKAMRGDILVSKSGSLGVCAIVDVDIEFSIYESIIVLQAKTSLNSNYLLWLMRDENTQLRMIGEKVGSTVAHLNIEMFRKLVIQKPPLLEQTAIAIVLSDTNDLITSLEKLIAKKRDIKQATMQQLLTGKKRLPGFAGDGSARLGDFFELNPNKSYLSDTDLVTFIRMEDISENGRIINQNIMPLSSIKNGLTYFERNDVLVAKITPCFENGKGACLDALETKCGFGSTEFHVLRAKKNAVPSANSRKVIDNVVR